MLPYNAMPREDLEQCYNRCNERYTRLKELGIRLDMSRGKPGSEQLELSAGMFACLKPDECISENGTDCRNYGGTGTSGVDGIPEMKRIFADMLRVGDDEVLVGGNSSLSLMFECAEVFSGAGRVPEDTVKFICPSPGYDRHFAVCEYLGIKMLPVAMTPDGPALDEVEEALSDPLVTGMWCVPVFSNPQGYTYSNDTVKALALLAKRAASPHFRLFWDNAYAVHSFDGDNEVRTNIMDECKRVEAYDRVLMFTSFSKITLAGSAVAAVAASPANLDALRKRISVRTVGPDKLNQMRHVRFFKDIEGVRKHMRKHADILRPKFETVLNRLDENLSGKGIAEWTRPRGGYFISMDTLPGCAKRTVALCAEAGLKITKAGATYPYGNDPQDRNIRIAPSYLSVEQLKQAMELFCAAVELAALEKLY